MQSYSIKYHFVEDGVEDPEDRWFLVDAKNADSAIAKLKKYVALDVSVLGVSVIGYY